MKLRCKKCKIGMITVVKHGRQVHKCQACGKTVGIGWEEIYQHEDDEKHHQAGGNF